MDEEEKKELDGIVIVDEDDDDGGVQENSEVRFEEPEPVAAPKTVDPELLAARAERDALRAQMASRQPAAVQPAPDTALQTREKELFDQQDALGAEYETLTSSGALTTEKHAELKEKSRSIQSQLYQVGAQRAAVADRPNQVRAQQNARYQSLYSDVYANKSATRFGEGRYHLLVAQGAPEDDSTVERAMNEARIQYGMVKGKPTDNDRALMSGVGGGGGRTKAPSNTVKFNKPLTQMAVEMYGDATNGDVTEAKKLFAKRIVLPNRRKAAAKRG